MKGVSFWQSVPTACACAAAVLWSVLLLPTESSAQGHPGETAEGSLNLQHLANLPRPTEVTQTYLAFRDNLAFVGASDGFRILDISNPKKPVELSHTVCNGAQGHLSVWGNLLFRSVDAPQSSTDCDSSNVTASTPGHFEGIQVFDISDLTAPQRIHSIHTDCGAATHALVPDPLNHRVFLYVSSYPLGGASLGPNCASLEVGDGHSRISIVEVPLENPQAATVSHYYLDQDTEYGTYLGAFTFRGCRSITVFSELNLAAAACFREGQLWDISNPASPVFLWRYRNDAVKPENIDLFASAAFTWDGKVVALGDMSGGGGAARCIDPEDQQGRVWFLDTQTGVELASYKVPRSEPGVCTTHLVGFVPQRGGRYTMVSSNFTGGTTVVDVNALLAGASAADAEVAWAKPAGGNVWSARWYNGAIYANDLSRGLDVYRLQDAARASAIRLPRLNPNTQEQVTR
jgi:hypothetical protein